MHRIRALAAAAGLVVTFVGLGTTAASAHVTVQPPTADKGGYTKLAFRVPNERPNASTVKLQVKFPDNFTLTSVSVKPVPGWTFTATKKTLDKPITSGESTITEVTSEITWEGGKVEPGQFQEFEVSVGKLPTDLDQLTFPAIQTYDNGEEVAWIEPRVTGQPDPKHPVPLLKLQADPEAAGTTPGTIAGGGVAVKADQATTTTESAESTASTARTIGILGLLVGTIALVAAVAALVTRSKKPAT